MLTTADRGRFTCSRGSAGVSSDQARTEVGESPALGQEFTRTNKRLTATSDAVRTASRVQSDLGACAYPAGARALVLRRLCELTISSRSATTRSGDCGAVRARGVSSRLEWCGR